MTINKPAQTNPSQSSGKPRSQPTIVQAQDRLYGFLLEIVKTWDAQDVLQEFKQIFIHQTRSVSSEIIVALYQIISANQEQIFRNTLKRSCYILVNNWEITRNYQAIQKLVLLFSDPSLDKPTVSPRVKRLRTWLRNFVASQDFQELKLFATRYADRGVIHWRDRYVPFLLVSQYTNLNNPFEQRQAAKNLYQKLKARFKFDLAMYTAHPPESASKHIAKNPTYLGDEVLDLIKKIVAKQGFFTYSNLAHIFLNQVQSLTYQNFKKSLLEYLIFSVNQNNTIANTLKEKLSDKLNDLYRDRHNQVLDSALLLRTANRVIEYLTTENDQEPSQIFILMLSEGNVLTLVIILLKVILICPYSRTHLEMQIASLIKLYEAYSEEDCKWVIHFLEIFNIIMALYTDDVEYSLINMAKYSQNQKTAAGGLESYRIFSQLRHPSFFNPPSSLLDLSPLDTAFSNMEALQNEA